MCGWVCVLGGGVGCVVRGLGWVCGWVCAGWRGWVCGLGG